jgi:hypothetical protein
MLCLAPALQEQQQQQWLRLGKAHYQLLMARAAEAVLLIQHCWPELCYL